MGVLRQNEKSHFYVLFRPQYPRRRFRQRRYLGCDFRYDTSISVNVELFPEKRLVDRISRYFVTRVNKF